MPYDLQPQFAAVELEEFGHQALVLDDDDPSGPGGADSFAPSCFVGRFHVWSQ
jgi:hypothetical protein